MSESSNIKDVVQAVEGVAKAIPIYQDLLQPAVQEVGKGLATVAKTVHVALAPVSGLLWCFDQVQEMVSTKVAERLKNVPPENIVTPPANVAGPALEALRWTGHQDALSDMYANLLAASMDRSTTKDAHPAFVEIIRQMTPDEAKLMGAFAQKQAHPLLHVRAQIQDGSGGGFDYVVNFNGLTELVKTDVPEMSGVYIDNLCRLGLVEIPGNQVLIGEGIYEPLEKSPEMQTIHAQISAMSDMTIPVMRRQMVQLTALGHVFVRACVRAKA